MDASDWAALYAAVIATGALFLEVRRWFESGLRLYVKASPGMSVISPGDSGPEEEGLLLVSVYNRGEVPTTITHFTLLEFKSVWARLRGRPSKSLVILHPQLSGMPPILPHELRPGTVWQGFARPRDEIVAMIEGGRSSAAIYVTGRDRPFVATIKAPRRSAA